MIPQELKERAPHKPGVYIFKDSKGRILYVGKAIDLYHRVSSYFNKHPANARISQLASEITEVETRVVESELEALILEANLIKKYLPPYNIRLTDDKDYLYIKVTKEPFPKVVTARKKDLDGSLRYFGPFPSSRMVKNTLKSLRKIFPWCSNPPKNTQDHATLLFAKGSQKHGLRPCFYYHLDQCPGACIGLVDQKTYRKNINRFIAFLEGRKDKLLTDLQKEMSSLAKKEKFEEAAKLKKTMDGIFYMLQPNRVSLYLENPDFLQQENLAALKQLQQVLHLEKILERIECFDISNIQGREAVGSMVVLTNGDIDKSQYRKFKIHLSGRPNDVGMMKEMVRRRLRHSEWPTADLILVDGGQGQVNAASLEIRISKLEIPIYGLAKRQEWLYSPDGQVIKLPKRSLSLRILQKIRDEAHRFAISYHRQLRNRAMILRD